ncbi:bifunctional riboflavin kinase/FAD synthetase [Allofranklinella schreckenbergeri]|uniref:Riboflavin biosynthesis protein n=1 Tax=Allofranklinella schreckenbergeri TaxID=1076744 RepID=A0A3M6R4I3_9BURK|nr:bifunctional riboflavin kinase/FAD synthetase [Allofranklinella schreckenbergeri]RMX09968.1 bifunctional riboflavin kinase/FAD synthetase [Allofranklinella schreckenbergeri]
MRTFLGVHHQTLACATALTIGNFDGVHRGHQAILALLRSEASSRGLQSCVLTFEPHPKDYFAKALNKPQIAPARIGTLRDKLTDLASNHIDQTVILPFTATLAAQSPQDFVSQVLVKALGVRYVLVGDDFRFGKQRAGDYALLDTLGKEMGFEVARMNSYEVHGLRVSSSEVRAALQEGRMQDAARLLGRPYTISGHVIHGRRLGRQLGESASGQGDGFRTLNLHFKHWKPAASGIFIVHVHGLTPQPLPGVANLGIRPSLDPNDLNGGRVLLETHCLEWPETLGAEGAYGKVIRVELLEKLHDEVRYPSISALTAGIAQDCEDARAWFARQTPA